MRCPVCKNENNENSTVCTSCGFSELNIEFLNKEDAQRWENTVLKQCRNIYKILSRKINHFDGYRLIEFDYPRMGCNVKIVDTQTPDEYVGTIIYSDRYEFHVQIPGKMKALKFALNNKGMTEREIERITALGYIIINKDQIFYLLDDVYVKEIEREEDISKHLRDKAHKEPFRESYDAFIKKNINSRAWCFTEDVIYYNEPYQKANTYFCAYDNPPFEIVNTIVSKNGTHYEIKVMLRNLSKERRNQPIRFRYRIGTPTDRNVNDWIDTITPAPQYTTAIIAFDYIGKDKPYFEIIN